MKNLPDKDEQRYVLSMAQRAVAKLGLRAEESGWDKLNQKYMVRIVQHNSGKANVVRIGQAMVERCMAERKDSDIVNEISRQAAEAFPQLGGGEP